MITRQNQRILTDILSKPKEHNKDAVSKKYLLTKMRINGFLEHVLTRLYAGFHITVGIDKTVIRQISLLTHLGLVNLRIIIYKDEATGVNVTLSPFGKVVMNKIMPSQKSKIRRTLQQKDKRRHTLAIMFGITGILAFVLNVWSITWKSMLNSNNFPRTLSVMMVITGIVMLYIITAGIIAYFYCEPKKHKFLINHEISLYSILKVCKIEKGQQQTECEKKYIIKYYQKQVKGLNKLIKSGTPGLNGYRIIQRPSEEINTRIY